MFRSQVKTTSRVGAVYVVLELIYHATVRSLRGNNSNAVIGLLMSVVRALLMVLVFALMFQILGLRSAKLRGDFMLYVMSGVFMYTTHVSAMMKVSRADSAISSMMLHSPMNPIIAIISAALAALYSQFLAATVILFLYHTLWHPLEIRDPIGTLGVFILAWGSGIGVGLIFYAFTPWNPAAFGIVTTLYQRANMIASGKMLVANQSPTWIRSKFDWNPLFHIIDQGRGEIFLNYNPRFTSLEYPILVLLFCIMIGLMGEFFTRKFISASWSKR